MSETRHVKSPASPVTRSPSAQMPPDQTAPSDTPPPPANGNGKSRKPREYDPVVRADSFAVFMAPRLRIPSDIGFEDAAEMAKMVKQVRLNLAPVMAALEDAGKKLREIIKEQA